MRHYLKSAGVAAVLAAAFLAAIGVRFLGREAPTERAAPAGAVPTDGFTVNAGYTHPTPGTPPSHICGYVTGPPHTATTIRVRDRDGLGFKQTVQVTTDGNGLAPFEVEVAALADYVVTATLGRTVAVDALEVTAAQSECPVRPLFPNRPERQEPLRHAVGI
jgi:hypothetical protein